MHSISFYSLPIEGGSIEINNTKISTNPWNGYYFDGIPVNLIAKPKKGYKFSRWEGVNSNSNLAVLKPNQGKVIVAVFEQKENFKDSVIINEINYNSSKDFDSEDWVELYNRSDSSIDISNWIFKDEDDSHSFNIPEGTILNSNSYIVLCNDSLLFSAAFPNVKNVIGDLGFGFSGNGELLRLFDDQLILIDSVNYDDTKPWPLEADGKGSTLELTNPNLNNDLAENWAASIGHGTPGDKNSVVTECE